MKSSFESLEDLQRIAQLFLNRSRDCGYLDFYSKEKSFGGVTLEISGSISTLARGDRIDLSI